MFDSVRLAAGWALWAGICAWAIARGRAPERIVGAAMLLGAVLTPFVQYNIGRNHTEFGVFVIDTTVLLIITFAALRSTRWWAMYCAAFHLCQELTHVVRLYNFDVSQFYYATAAMFWSFAGLFSLAYGVGQVEWLNWRQWRVVSAPIPQTAVPARPSPAEHERVDHY